MRRSATSRSRQAGERFARGGSRKTTPQRARSWRAKISAWPQAAGRCGATGPSVRARGADARCGRSLAARAAWVEQRAQILESIGGHQTGGHQFPERVFHFAGQAAGGAREIGEERRAVRFEGRQHFARRMRERFRGEGCGVASSQAASSRRKMASGATRVGRTRRLPVLLGLAFEGGVGREPSPAHFAGQAELVQILRLVARHARRQNLRLPRGGGEFAALQLADDLQRAIHAVQLRARLQVLPAVQEREEFRRGDRLDFAAQPADGEAVNARQQAAVAPFHLAARGR